LTPQLDCLPFRFPGATGRKKNVPCNEKRCSAESDRIEDPEDRHAKILAFVLEAVEERGPLLTSNFVSLRPAEDHQGKQN